VPNEQYTPYIAPGCRVQMGVDLPIGPGAVVNIPFDTLLEQDLGPFWTPGAPTDIVIQEDGVYVMSAHIGWSGGAAFHQWTTVYRASDGKIIATSEETAPAASVNIYCTPSNGVRLNRGDVIRVAVFNGDAAPRSVLGASGGEGYATFTIRRLSA
jgi:hypothetical protein